MAIVGKGNETYLYITGLNTTEEISLGEGKVLIPAQGSVPLDIVSKMVKNDVELAIAILCAERISSQLKITSQNSKELAVLAWNAQWDLVLLNAVFNCSAMWNLQSTHSINQINLDSYLNITHYQMNNLLSDVYKITSYDAIWLGKYFSNAQMLIERDAFMTSVHSLASYKWHTLPRVQLAVLWAGIESLFGINNELSFRISLYTSKLLGEGDKEQEKSIFAEVKTLYTARSSAVHGSKVKGDINSLVKKSADILNKLIRKCCENNSMPDIGSLIF